MEEQTLSISEAQREITRLPEQFEEDNFKAITVTRYGKPVMAILPFETYKIMVKYLNWQFEMIQSLLETMDILGDEEQMASFRRGVEDIKAGRVRPWEEVKKELGLE
jgi:PHD/YefM family antitoxin component YafN of YafNO toxin-antitoxin module